MSVEPAAEAVYRDRAQRFAQLENEEAQHSDRISNWRLWSFLAAVGLIILSTSLWRDHATLLLSGFAAALACFAAFIAFVLKHHRLDERRERNACLRSINEQASHRIKREWKAFPAPKAPQKLCQQTVARDLDLFGTGSLFHFLCTAHSSQGRYLLASWLTHRADSKVLKERHHALRELAPKLDWRQELHAKGMGLADEPDEQPILTWTSSKSWLTQHPWALILSKILPLGLLALIVLTALTDRHWWIFGIAAHWIFTRIFRSPLNAVLGTISDQEKPLRHYVSAFSHVETLAVECSKLTELKAKLESAYGGMKQLSHLATQADARGSIIHPILQYLFLWDFHTAASVERWQAKHGECVADWFRALGEIEALASLAQLHYDEPEWAFPDFTSGGSLIAKQLAHPLIAGDQRIGNDVTLGPPGSFLLVTGSNMSGKSTLLRSTGLNVTLAQAGAPVCAADLTLSPFQLATSMRVQDSLTDGVSFFMAELQGIKEVVQLADTIAADEAEDHLLYLLDEILQGTNTEERQIIVQRVLSHLVRQGAIGAVTTHDFALAEIEEFKPVSQLGHFREEFSDDESGPQMTFDYQLRPGVATTTNAVKLLEIIDLNV